MGERSTSLLLEEWRLRLIEPDNETVSDSDLYRRGPPIYPDFEAISLAPVEKRGDEYWSLPLDGEEWTQGFPPSLTGRCDHNVLGVL
jgi:hypothetical protein